MRFDNIKNRQKSAVFQIAPLIDCVFLLLLFFICAGQINKMESVLKLTVPEPGNGDTMQEVIVKIKNDRSFEIEGCGRLEINQIKEKLKELYKACPDQLVIIKGDNEAIHDDIVKIMDVCAEAGLKKVAIGIKKE